MTPYAYHIFHRLTQQHYYGVKFAQDADPNLFWKTYFTSSDRVKNLIERYGVESFDVSIRRTFLTAEEAILWETKVLNKIDAKNKKDWLNQHNGAGHFGILTEDAKEKMLISRRKTLDSMSVNERKEKYGHALDSRLTEEHKERISKSQKLRLANMSSDDKIKAFSRPHDDITKQKIADSRTGTCHSTLTKDKISKAHKGKTWRMVNGKRKWFDKENI